jgi:hypothetical protein
VLIACAAKLVGEVMVAERVVADTQGLLNAGNGW